MSVKFAAIVFTAWILTFVVFFAVSFHGGAAITGKAESGHYYVGQHGNYAEVSHGRYIFSAVLTALLGLGLPMLACPMIRQELRKRGQPLWHPVGLLGALMSLVIGVGTWFDSLRCIFRT